MILGVGFWEYLEAFVFVFLDGINYDLRSLYGKVYYWRGCVDGLDEKVYRDE